MLKITNAFIYPVKSCAAVAMPAFAIGPRGPLLDRQWMIVDDDGKMLTQRQVPQLALIHINLNEKHEAIQLSLPGGWTSSFFASLGFSADAANFQRRSEHVLQERTVSVWADSVLAVDEGDEIASKLSEFIGRSCRLVQMHPQHQRVLNEKYGVAGSHTGFADGMPLLLTTESSLLELNTRLFSGAPSSTSLIPMSRFRPNLVVSALDESNLPAFDEDAWRDLKVGDVNLKFSRLCSRCQVITIDQLTGLSAGPEPLKTLATYRRDGSRVNFGINLIHLSHGTIRVGDEVHILSREPHQA